MRAVHYRWRKIVEAWRNYWWMPSDEELCAMCDQGWLDWCAQFPDWYEEGYR